MKWIQGIILAALTLMSILLLNTADTTTEEAADKVQADCSTATSTERRYMKTRLNIRVKFSNTLHHQEGDAAFLECLAAGRPVPSIHWLKDGVIISQIEESHASDLEADGVNSERNFKVSSMTSRLYLDCLSVEDEGRYSCVAENLYHRNSTDTQISVISADGVACRNKSHGQAPRIIQWTKGLMGIQGESATLICRADGYPAPTIRWLGANDQELSTADSSKFQVLPEGDLVIHRVDWNDMGIFNCIAENVHGEAKEEVFLFPSMMSKQCQEI